MCISLQALMRDYPEIQDASWKYVDNWYDGPTMGLLDSDKNLYAVLHEESDLGERTFKIIAMTDESYVKWRRMHDAFERYVGVYRGPSDIDYHPFTEHHKFFERYESEKFTLPEGKVVGWFRQ